MMTKTLKKSKISLKAKQKVVYLENSPVVNDVIYSLAV